MSITAMKQALEALEICAVRQDHQWHGLQQVSIAKAALRQAIEQAEKQEPVVWMYQDKSTHEVRFQKHMRSFVDHGATYETPLYTTPQPQRELNCVCGAVWEGDEMVCVPHKREWVGLMDEEVVRIKLDGRDLEFVSMTALRRFAKDIEAKLKEKNNG
jgi:hypothetical protein